MALSSWGEVNSSGDRHLWLLGLTADMNRSVISVFFVKPQKLQTHLPGALARVKENGGHVEFAMHSRFNAADAQIRVQRFKIGDENQNILFAFQGFKQGFEPLLQAFATQKRVGNEIIGLLPIKRGLAIRCHPDFITRVSRQQGFNLFRN